MVSSPLILGLNVTDKARLDSVWPILSNKEAIAVNKAWQVKSPPPPRPPQTPTTQRLSALLHRASHQPLTSSPAACC